MTTTQTRLQQLQSHLDESIGIRNDGTRPPKLSPIPSRKDVGRRPLRTAARIQIDQIVPDPTQPRDEFSDGSIERLARSLREKGQLAPIRVRWRGELNKWVITCGERRWRAARSAELEFVDCLCDDGDLTESEVLELQMIENLLREDLSPIEQARGFAALMDLHGWNGRQVADALHVPASTVSRALALLDLPADIQQRVDVGELAARSAYEISKVKDESTQRDLAAKAANGMTLKQTQKATQIARRKSKPKSAAASKRLEFFTDHGWKIIAVAPPDSQRRTYEHLREAMDHVNEDIDARIRSNIRID